MSQRIPTASMWRHSRDGSEWKVTSRYLYERTSRDVIPSVRLSRFHPRSNNCIVRHVSEELLLLTHRRMP